MVKAGANNTQKYSNVAVRNMAGRYSCGLIGGGMLRLSINHSVLIMPPKKNKSEEKAPAKNQLTLEKWLSPIKKKQEPEKAVEEPPEPVEMDIEASGESDSESSPSEHVQTRKQSIEKIEQRVSLGMARKAAKKEPKVPKPDPKQ
jgi:hypothetical protein